MGTIKKGRETIGFYKLTLIRLYELLNKSLNMILNNIWGINFILDNETSENVRKIEKELPEFIGDNRLAR